MWVSDAKLYKLKENYFDLIKVSYISELKYFDPNAYRQTAVDDNKKGWYLLIVVDGTQTYIHYFDETYLEVKKEYDSFIKAVEKAKGE